MAQTPDLRGTGCSGAAGPAETEGGCGAGRRRSPPPRYAYWGVAPVNFTIFA